MVTTVPACPHASRTRAPPTNVPFRDPRSSMATPPPRTLSAQCRALTVASRTTRSAPRATCPTTSAPCDERDAPGPGLVLTSTTQRRAARRVDGDLERVATTARLLDARGTCAPRPLRHAAHRTDRAADGCVPKGRLETARAPQPTAMPSVLRSAKYCSLTEKTRSSFIFSAGGRSPGQLRLGAR